MPRKLVIRGEMDELAAELRSNIKKQPGRFDLREKLWMRREDLRAELNRLARSSTMSVGWMSAGLMFLEWWATR